MESRTDHRNSPLQRVIDGIARCVRAGAACTLLAWVVGRIATDSTVWSQWLHWIPTPIVLGFLLLACIASLPGTPRATVRRRRFAVWTAIFVATAGYFALFEYRFFLPDSHDRDGLRIMQSTHHPWPKETEEFIDVLIEQGADLTILSHQAYMPIRQRVREWLGNEFGGYHLRGFSIYTRLPILRGVDVHEDAEIYAAMIELDATAILGRSIVMYLVDLPSGRTRARAGIAQDVRRAFADLDLPPPDLVIGDFNMPRGSASILAAFPGLTHAYDQGGHGYSATYPRTFPLYHIDHILVGGGLRATDYDIVDPGFGRHRIQTATISAAD